MIEHPEIPNTPADSVVPAATARRARVRRALLALPLVLALAAVGFDLARPTNGAGYRSAAAPTAAPGSGCVSPSATASTNFADMSLSTFIGQHAGTRLAGNAPLYLSADQVRTLGDGVPAGASVDACADRITFTGAAVSFSVEAVPPVNPDMTFRIGALVNPTVVVQQGAQITIEFVNADTDQAHGWLVTTAQAPFAFRPSGATAFPGAQAAVIGDPVNGRQGARTITFTAGPAGQYEYICPMPGHAEMGMHGSFIVAP